MCIFLGNSVSNANWDAANITEDLNLLFNVMHLYEAKSFVHALKATVQYRIQFIFMTHSLANIELSLSKFIDHKQSNVIF